MIRTVTHAHLVSIWYHSKPLDVHPLFPYQFLGQDYFCRFLQQGSSNKVIESNWNENFQKRELIDELCSESEKVKSQFHKIKCKKTSLPDWCKDLLKRSFNSVTLSVDGTIPELQDRKSSTPSTSKPVPVLDSPCSVASDGSSTNWNGIPRVRRKWVDVVEGKLTRVLAEIFLFLTI